MTAAPQIGASQAAAAAGLNPYCPPIRLWAELMGLEPAFVGNERTRWGTKLEPLVRSEYCAKHGVILFKPNESVLRPGAEWRRASPDSVVLDNPWLKGRPHWVRGLECKNTNWRSAYRWEDGPPQEVEIQARWSMHVTELPRWDVAVLIGGDDYRDFQLDRDLDFEGSLVEAVEQFYTDHVIARVPPSPDGSSAYTQYLLKRWPHLSEGPPLPRSAELDAAVEMLRACRAALASKKEEERALTQELLLLVGEAAAFESADGTVRCRQQRGKPSYKRVAEALQTEHGVSALEFCALLEQHRGNPSRPIRLPARKDDDPPDATDTDE